MIFAHLGGVDEVGIFLVPALIAILTLRSAEKRAKVRAEEYDRLEADEKAKGEVPREEKPKEPGFEPDDSGSG